MLDHKFKTPEKSGLSYKTKYISDLQPTKTIYESDLQAVKKRFIEVFVRSRPTLPQNALPTCGSFTRDHLIIGLFCQVVRILFKYNKTDYNSEYLYLYPISSCCKNLYKIKPSLQAPLKDLLIQLMDKYCFNDCQKQMCFDNLKHINAPPSDVQVTLEDILDN